MTNTTTNQFTDVPIRVLYNDAAVNRKSSAEEAIPGFRASELDSETRRSGQVMMASARILTGEYYQAGDPLLEVYTETARICAHDLQVRPKSTHQAICERMFGLLNAHHPPGWSHRSMSTGDIVVIGETAWVCESVGFSPCDISDSETKSVTR